MTDSRARITTRIVAIVTLAVGVSMAAAGPAAACVVMSPPGGTGVIKLDSTFSGDAASEARGSALTTVTLTVTDGPNLGMTKRVRPHAADSVEVTGFSCGDTVALTGVAGTGPALEIGTPQIDRGSITIDCDPMDDWGVWEFVAVSTNLDYLSGVRVRPKARRDVVDLIGGHVRRFEPLLNDRVKYKQDATITLLDQPPATSGTSVVRNGNKLRIRSDDSSFAPHTYRLRYRVTTKYGRVALGYVVIHTGTSYQPMC